MHPKLEYPISQEVLDNSAFMTAPGRQAKIASVPVQTKPGNAGIVSQALSPGFMVWDKLAGI